MKQSYLILENKFGQTARVMPFDGKELDVVYRLDSRRIEVVPSAKELTEEEIPFESLGRVAKSSKPGDVILRGPWGQLRHVQQVDVVLRDVKERKEEGPEFKFFLKWTAAGQIALVLSCMAISWLIAKYSTPEVQVVKVFRRPPIVKQETPTVKASAKKVREPKKPQYARKTTKLQNRQIVRNSTTRTKGRNLRAGNDVRRMGALSALGGLNKNATGLGGLSNARSNSSGFGFDSSKARGGHQRGMLGKGLMEGGIGRGETLSGYDGYGTKGRGRGQGGYGVVNMAGRSGGYFLPLGEEASIEGGLDRDQINAVIQRHLGQVTYCYEQGLQVKPGLAGRVAVKFTIAPSGRVSVADVAHTSLASSKVESCILAKLKSWQFPKPKGNVAVRVTYPFILKRLNQG